MKRLLTFLFLLVLTASGCTQTEKKEEITKKATEKDTAQEKAAPKKGETSRRGKRGKVVALVNGQPIYKRDLRGRSVESAVADEIIYQEGLRQGLDKKFEEQVEDYKKGLIIESVRRELLANVPNDGDVSDEEIEKYYEENKNNYTFLSIKEISTDDKSIAEEMHKRALEGEEFEKIQSEYSNSGKQVTLTGPRFINKKYNNRFDKIEVGSVSEIIQEGKQFKILKITDVKEIPILKAKNSIRYVILAQRRGQALQGLVEELKEKNNTKVEILVGNKKK